jgi:GTPase SAR1 family protein
MSSHQLPESSVVLPTSEGGEGFVSIHLLVMGLSGAGKSTFISKATGNTSVVTGAGISGGKLVISQPYSMVVL